MSIYNSLLFLFISFLVGLTSCTRSSPVEEEPKIEEKIKYIPSITANTSSFSLLEKAFGSQKKDQGYKIISTKDGNYLITGLTEEKDLPTFNAIILKIDPNGNEIWRTIYGKPRISEIGCDLVELENGAFIVLNKVMKGGFYSGASLLKIDREGNRIWDKRYRENSRFEPKNILINQDSQILIGGVLAEKRRNHGYLLWVDKDGNKIKDQTYGGYNFPTNPKFAKYDENINATTFPLGESTNKIIQAQNGNYFFAGKTRTKAQKGNIPNGWLVRLNNEGELIWDKGIVKSGVREVIDMFETENNNLALISQCSNPDLRKPTFGLSIYNQEGKLLLDEEYIHEKNNEVIQGLVLPSGDMILLGSVNSNQIVENRQIDLKNISDEEKEKLLDDGWKLHIAGQVDHEIKYEYLSKKIPLTDEEIQKNKDRNEDVWLCRVNSKGEVIWQKTFGGPGNDKVRSMALDTDNNLILCGYSGSNDFREMDIWFFKMKP